VFSVQSCRTVPGKKATQVFTSLRYLENILTTQVKFLIYLCLVINITSNGLEIMQALLCRKCFTTFTGNILQEVKELKRVQRQNRSASSEMFQCFIIPEFPLVTKS
jgi:hypothetical protein